MSRGLEELKRMAYENACCRCQYYIDKKCTNNGECVWKTIEKELKDKEKFEELVNTDLDLFMKMVDIKGLIEDYQKFSKALEVIKPYIHIYCVAPNDRGGVRVWLTQDGKHYIDMPQEEYDLFKEVLNYGGEN